MTVDGTEISMIRGDSESITVACTDLSGAAIPFVAGDKVYFTVKTRISEAVATLQKLVTTFTDGKAIIIINPVDTKTLRVMRYYYDVQLTKEDGTVTTLVPPSRFTLEGDVTSE